MAQAGAQARRARYPAEDGGRSYGCNADQARGALVVGAV